MRYIKFFVSFLVLGMISGIVCATKNVDIDDVTLSTSQSSRGTSTETFDAGQTFYVHLKLKNIDTVNLTTSDNINVRIEIDGAGAYDQTLQAPDIIPGGTGYIVISSSSFEDEWKNKLLAYECKDDMTVDINIEGDVESQTDDHARLTIEEGGTDKTLSLSLNPEKPTADDEFTVTVVDDGGDPVSGARIRITEFGSNGKWDEGDDYKETYTTNSDGQESITLSTESKFKNPKGIYQVEAYKTGYCKDTTTFEITKKLFLTGPEPANPQTGQSFKIKVTDGTNPLRGIIVIINPGLRKSTTTSDGYATFSGISTTGPFSADAASSGYDEPTPITFTISEKPILSVSITPTDPKLGDTLTITVTSAGSTVTGATVSITPPNGAAKTFPTASTGKITYTIQSSGYHSVDVTKDGYTSGAGGFTVLNSFNVVFPDLADKKSGDEISVAVKDGAGSNIAGASVSVLGTTISGTTDAQGIFNFNLPKTGSYALHVAKDGFTAKDTSFKSLGFLSIKLSSKKAEIGEKVKITVLDESGTKLYGNIQITQPDGIKENVVKDEYDYVPSQAGTYTITVSKESYTSVAETFEVMLKPIVYTSVIDGSTLKITALSVGIPVEGVTLVVTTPSGDKKDVLTDKDGLALIKADQPGEYSVTTKDQKYDSGTVTITKKGLSSLMWWVILALLIILFLILLVGVGIFHWHFKRKRGRLDRERASSLG